MFAPARTQPCVLFVLCCLCGGLYLHRFKASQDQRNAYETGTCSTRIRDRVNHSCAEATDPSSACCVAEVNVSSRCTDLRYWLTFDPRHVDCPQTLVCDDAVSISQCWQSVPTNYSCAYRDVCRFQDDLPALDHMALGIGVICLTIAGCQALYRIIRVLRFYRQRTRRQEETRPLLLTVATPRPTLVINPVVRSDHCPCCLEAWPTDLWEAVDWNPSVDVLVCGHLIHGACRRQLRVAVCPLCRTPLLQPDAPGRCGARPDDSAEWIDRFNR